MKINGYEIKPGANLQGAKLSRANLEGANLQGANLKGAYLYHANLYGAYLQDANLKGADLSCAVLYLASLQGADLKGASLQGADFKGANLRSANLEDANLEDANLEDANLEDAKGLPKSRCPLTGDFQAWKKCRRGVIVELLVTGARSSSYTSGKCRASEVRVVAVHGAEVGVSIYDHSAQYRKGEVVKVEGFVVDCRVECAAGIHFFMTREEAEAYG